MRRALLAALAGLSSVVPAQGAPSASLTDPGASVRGRAIVADRQLGMCLLCHRGPFPEEPTQGDLAPDLRGVGKRYTEAQLRQRIVDPLQINSASIMPSYGQSKGLWRVAPALRGRPLLTAEQIEDVVAFLTTLRD